MINVVQFNFIGNKQYVTTNNIYPRSVTEYNKLRVPRYILNIVRHSNSYYRYRLYLYFVLPCQYAYCTYNLIWTYLDSTLVVPCPSQHY